MGRHHGKFDRVLPGDEAATNEVQELGIESDFFTDVEVIEEETKES